MGRKLCTDGDSLPPTRDGFLYAGDLKVHSPLLEEMNLHSVEKIL